VTHGQAVIFLSNTRGFKRKRGPLRKRRYLLCKEDHEVCHWSAVPSPGQDLMRSLSVWPIQHSAK